GGAAPPAGNDEDGVPVSVWNATRLLWETARREAEQVQEAALEIVRGELRAKEEELVRNQGELTQREAAFAQTRPSLDHALASSQQAREALERQLAEQAAEGQRLRAGSEQRSHGSTPSKPTRAKNNCGRSTQRRWPRGSATCTTPRRGTPRLVGTIDPQVLVVHALYPRQQLGITSGSRGQQRRIALARRVAPIRRRGNLQRTADRLDPATSAVLVNEGVHFLSWRSNSAWAKYALASFRI